MNVLLTYGVAIFGMLRTSCNCAIYRSPVAAVQVRPVSGQNRTCCNVPRRSTIPIVDVLTCLLCIVLARSEFRGWKKHG